MDSLNKHSSAPTNKKTKLAKTFQKVTHLRKSTNSFSSNTKSPHFDRKNNKNDDTTSSRNRAAMEAFLAKLFATVSAVKSAYAELQMAQFPYNPEAIRSADDAVVSELQYLSELKQSFLKKKIDSSSPHVTLLLAEIQEQQSLMKIYGINNKRIQSQLETKKNHISMLQKQLSEIISHNNSLTKTLNNSSTDGVKFSNPNDFISVLKYTMRSVRCFVKLMIQEMVSSNWDIEAAANSIEPETKHTCFAFESFVCREMFDGFDSHNESTPQSRLVFVEQFRKLKAVINPIQFLKTNPNSEFGKFTRSKYLRLVHPKMETSFFRDLTQRKLIGSGKFPETEFFAVFAEMAKRVWLLHCLAFTFDEEVSIFQVGKNSRFSELYMESVTDDAAENGVDGGFRVAFTVVPGFKIGKTVVQSQVYLFPAAIPGKFGSFNSVHRTRRRKGWS